MNDLANLEVKPNSTAAQQPIDVQAGPANQIAAAPRRQTVSGFIGRATRVFVIVALLGGVAWWGHENDWAMPKFAALFGAEEPEKDDWCKDHSVPKSKCIVHNPALAPWVKHYGWCEEHGVHDCPFENEDVVQLEEPPSIRADLGRAGRTLAFKDWPKNSKDCKSVERVVQIASKEAWEKMNIDLKEVKRQRIVETVAVSGELQFMPKGIAAASCSVSGRVWQVTTKGQLGGTVKQGDVLAIVDAAEVGEARAELLQAYAQLESRKQLLEGAQSASSTGALPSTRLVELQAAHDESFIRFKAAQQALINLGLPVDEQQIKGLTPAKLAELLPVLGLPPDVSKVLDNRNLSANLIPGRAPRDGVITEVKVHEGETFEPSKALFVVADTAKLWLLLNVRQQDVPYLTIRQPAPDGSKGVEGQNVIFKLPGGITEFEGHLVWKASVADEKARTIQFAAEVPNDKRLLAANSYVTAQIVIREEENATVVPNDAIHWEGDSFVVFVKDKNWAEKEKNKAPDDDPLMFFHVRGVRPGVRNNGETEIIVGLLPGEIVASTNSAVLRAALLSKNLPD